MVVIACQRAATKLSSQRVALLRLQRCHTQFSTSILRPGPQIQSFRIPNYTPGQEKSCLSLQLINTRYFHTTRASNEIVQFHLSDIGEGIKEVTVKEW